MTNYNDLSKSEKEKVLEVLKDESHAIKVAVLKGDYCAICLMIYYNCLCSR